MYSNNLGSSETPHSAQCSAGEHGNMPIYSEPIYSYPTSPPMRGAQISTNILSSPLTLHKHKGSNENAAIKAKQKKESKQMNLYGTLPRAQIRRRQPLQRLDSENTSETEDASNNSLQLTRATTFFQCDDDQDFYAEASNGVRMNSNLQNTDQIINARNLSHYATLGYHRPGAHPQPPAPYFQHLPSLLCGPMVPLQIAPALNHPSLMSQQLHSAPMAQWSRDDLHLILNTENGGGGLSGSSGRNMVLDSKKHFKSQIRKLDRQQKISRSFEQLVELTEPDDDDESGSSLPHLDMQMTDTKINNKKNFMKSMITDDKMHGTPFSDSDFKHEDNVGDLLNKSNSSNSSSSSSNQESSPNDTRYIAVNN